MGTICNQEPRHRIHATLEKSLESIDRLFEKEARQPSADARLAAAVEMFKLEYTVDDYDRQDENICGIYQALNAVAIALEGIADVASAIERIGVETSGVATATQNIATIIDDARWARP